MNDVSETIIRALDSARLAEQDIRGANMAANPVESMVIVDALESAIKTRRRLECLVDALEAS